MNNYKLLFKNIGLLTISNFATKLLSFFMVPLYTNILSTTDYGTYDLLNTSIGLLVPLLTVDIQEAVLRFSVDKEGNRKKVFSTGLNYVAISTLIVVLITAINKFFCFIPILSDYAIFFIALYIVTALSGVLSYFARGINRISDISVAGVLSTIVMISSNILFLIFLDLGLVGYFIASIMGISAQVIYLLFRIGVKNYFQKLKLTDPTSKEMVKYSSPMVANAVAWWANSASDRYVVSWFCGIAENGILSVSYKIPSIISIMQGIFSQAWSLSAIRDFDKDDSDGFFSNTYNSYNLLLVLMCSVLIFLNKPLSKVLFAKDFYSAWKYAPFLMIGTVFSGMSGYIGGILTAKKKTGTFAITSTITAVVNAILNFLLVFYYGAVGAVIATAFAYFLMWLLRVREMQKYIKIRLNLKRDYFAYLLLVVQAFLLLIYSGDRLFLIDQLAFVLLIVLIYVKEIKLICFNLLARFK